MTSYKRPKKYDYNVVVIGAGSAGLVASLIASTIKAKVALIEKHKMGGDCLNTGCVPSKTLIKSAKIASLANRAQDFGMNSIDVNFDFAKVMERVQSVIKRIEPHDSVERFTGLGVECHIGNAKILTPWEVQVGEKILTTRAIIVSTGARPFVPPIKGVENSGFLTSDTIWNLREQPKNMIVLGGGPIGCELAQSFQRLGSNVTLVEMAPNIMAREDDDIIELVTNKFKKEGLQLLTSHKAVEFKTEGSQKQLLVESEGQVNTLLYDQVLLAIGRKPNIEGFGLEELGVKIAPNGTVAHNDFLQTNYPNIYVCGDVAGPYQFTHMASHQAYYATVNALFRKYTRFLPPPFNKNFKVDYSVVPWATYTDPEIGTVGLTEKTAQSQGVPYEITKYDLSALDRAIADGEDYGLVKVLTKPGTDQILGATVVGQHAGDLVGEFVSAMKNNYGLNKIMGTIHIYPTMMEANKFAAGNWKKARKPEGALNFLKKFHSWNR